MKIEKWACDLCNREVEEKELKKVTVPIAALNCEARYTGNVEYKGFELCPECREKFANAVFNGFAKVYMYANEVVKIEQK